MANKKKTYAELVTAIEKKKIEWGGEDYAEEISPDISLECILNVANPKVFRKDDIKNAIRRWRTQSLEIIDEDWEDADDFRREIQKMYKDALETIAMRFEYNSAFQRLRDDLKRERRSR